MAHRALLLSYRVSVYDPRVAVVGSEAMAGLLIQPSRDTAPTTAVSSQPCGMVAFMTEIIPGVMWPESAVVVTGVTQLSPNTLGLPGSHATRLR
jgi:hypothetical protein